MQISKMILNRRFFSFKKKNSLKMYLVRIFVIVWLGVVIELISSDWIVIATCADSYIGPKKKKICVFTI